MCDAEYADTARQRKSRLPGQIQYAVSSLFMWLTLLLIGIFAAAAFLFISMLELLWELADKGKAHSASIGSSQNF
ncbi:MAG: hypothetical protein ACI3W5_02475 [Faecousia sp.]